MKEFSLFRCCKRGKKQFLFPLHYTFEGGEELFLCIPNKAEGLIVDPEFAFCYMSECGERQFGFHHKVDEVVLVVWSN